MHDSRRFDCMFAEILGHQPRTSASTPVVGHFNVAKRVNLPREHARWRILVDKEVGDADTLSQKVIANRTPWEITADAPCKLSIESGTSDADRDINLGPNGESMEFVATSKSRCRFGNNREKGFTYTQHITCHRRSPHSLE
jgi:hypothetical protein